RALRDAAHRGNLGEREPAEELQVDDLGQLRFHAGQLVERVADLDQRERFRDAVGVVADERGQLEQAAALLRAATPDVVDDQPAHHPRRVSHEPRVVGEHRPVPPRHRQVGLVEERRDAEPGAGPLAMQLAAGYPVQLGIQGIEQGIGVHGPGGPRRRCLEYGVHFDRSPSIHNRNWTEEDDRAPLPSRGSLAALARLSYWTAEAFTLTVLKAAAIEAWGRGASEQLATALARPSSFSGFPGAVTSGTE